MSGVSGWVRCGPWCDGVHGMPARQVRGGAWEHDLRHVHRRHGRARTRNHPVRAVPGERYLERDQHALPLRRGLLRNHRRGSLHLPRLSGGRRLHAAGHDARDAHCVAGMVEANPRPVRPMRARYSVFWRGELRGFACCAVCGAAKLQAPAGARQVARPRKFAMCGSVPEASAMRALCLSHGAERICRPLDRSHERRRRVARRRGAVSWCAKRLQATPSCRRAPPSASVRSRPRSRTPARR